MVAGVLLGVLIPGVAAVTQPVITPAIAVMLFSTFLTIPFTHVGRAFSDLRFLFLLVVLNFVLAPAVVWVLIRPLAHQPAVVVGLTLVLLAPCIDWVVVFTRLAGGDSARLTAATPVLMVLQMLLVAPLMLVIAGPHAVVAIPPEPFFTATLLVLLPLVTAGVVQYAADRFHSAARIHEVGQAGMVPAVAAVLLVVVSSHVTELGSHGKEVLWTIPICIAFAIVMTAVTVLLTRLTGTPVPAARAAIFSAVARNSLVVLPIALALPQDYALAPVVVLTQTMVELVIMVLLVRTVPVLCRRSMERP